MIEAADVDVEVIVQAGLDQSCPHDEVEESAAGFYSIAEARREEAAVSCSNAELLPAPGGRQSPAARPAAVHGQLQVYHLLSSES